MPFVFVRRDFKSTVSGKYQNVTYPSLNTNKQTHQLCSLISPAPSEGPSEQKNSEEEDEDEDDDSIFKKPFSEVCESPFYSYSVYVSTGIWHS